MTQILEGEAVYEFIGELAIALYSKKIQISFSSLNQILQDNGATAYGNNHGVAAGVSAAYRFWEKKDPVIHHAISYTYTNKDGELSWK